MVDTVISGQKTILRYDKGSLTYTHIKPDAANDAIYETADAMNSLQAQAAVSISKIMTRKIIDLG
jgi:hypothetical protein